MKDIFSSGTTPLLQYWVAARAIPGEWESGDQYLVAPFSHGVLIAVVDGLGHGSKAAVAAKTAIATLAEHAGEPVVSLVQHCHTALRRTRGAVMSLATLNGLDNTMSWLGIGNVEGVLVSSRQGPAPRNVSLLLRGGIVGDRLPRLLPSTMQLTPGDLLFFGTDGIRSTFIQDIQYVEQPFGLMHQLFFRHGRNTDDALLLGAKWTNDQVMQESMQHRNPPPEPDTRH